ncbi:MAG: MFS transporter [Chloroflexota bacterium]|nr:MFS transporter [Chloroflexota bacterium]
MARHSRLLWSVCIGHLTNDVFASMTPVLLTFLAAGILPMSNAQIGLTVGIAQLLNALPQPFFGLRADRSGGRRLGAFGLALHVGLFTVAVVLAAETRQYWLMFFPLVIAPIGSAALHPVGALHAAEAMPQRSAFNMALFFLMGQTGLALGPAIAGILLDRANPNLLGRMGDLVGVFAFGMQNDVTPIVLLSLISIPGMLLMWTNIPKHHEHHAAKDERNSLGQNGAKQHFPLLAFVILGLIVILRGLGQQGSVAFVPLLFEQKGWSPAAYGTITSSFWIASGISGLLFGRLADRFDRRVVMMLSMILSAPAFFLLPAYEGAFAFILAIAAGGLSGGAHSLIVVMAQDLIPMRKGFASGAILGFIFATGAIGSLAIGVISEQIGLSLTFQIVALMIAVAGALSMLLPRASKAE